MRRKKTSQHIYTFVLTKRKPYIIAALLLSVTMASIGSLLIPKKSGSVYNFVLKSCIDSFVMTDSASKLSPKNPLNLTSYDIFGQISPVFSKADDRAFLASAKDTTDTPAPDVKEEPEEKSPVITKSVISHNLEIKNETDYIINPHELSSAKRTYNSVSSKSKVLIIHTHGCETYSSINGTGLGKNNSYRTTDNEKNMVKIGEAMAEIFIKNGIEVIHDKTLCDYPDYNSSYVKSLEVIEWHLKNNPDICYVFDIHRDAIEDKDGTPAKLLCKINGKDTSQAMIVCGTDAMGLDNPNWQENLILALKIQKNLEEMYPGFMRPLNLRNERFNMHKTTGSLLFEVGTHANTLDEALNGAKYLAEGIAKVIG